MSENAKFDLNSVVETAKQILTQPKQFYQQMPNSGGYTNPLIFVVVMGLATGVLGAVSPYGDQLPVPGRTRSSVHFLHLNDPLYSAVQKCRIFLHECPHVEKYSMFMHCSVRKCI